MKRRLVRGDQLRGAWSLNVPCLIADVIQIWQKLNGHAVMIGLVQDGTEHLGICKLRVLAELMHNVQVSISA
jgi:hypothetical protein